MSNAVMSGQFRKYGKAVPFRRFAIHLADGRYLAVGHPANVAGSGSGRRVAVLDPETGTFEQVDLLLVTSLRPLNGRNRGRKPR